MGRPRLKSVYDASVTLHLTVKERTNVVLCQLAVSQEATKSKILEKLLYESDTFSKEYARLKLKKVF